MIRKILGILVITCPLMVVEFTILQTRKQKGEMVNFFSELLGFCTWLGLGLWLICGEDEKEAK